MLTDDAAGDLARGPSCFARPIAVWQVDRHRARPGRAGTDPRESVSPPEQALDLVGTLREAELDIVIEHGEVRGEIAGLEVARVVVRDGDARIEVGVGRNDREAFAMVHGDVPTADALAGVVDAGAPAPARPAISTHPLARLAPERWLRSTWFVSRLWSAPRRLEADRADVAPREPEGSLAGHRRRATTDDEPVVVACSVGVDLDLVPPPPMPASPPLRTLGCCWRCPSATPIRSPDGSGRALSEPAEIVTVPDDFRR